MSYFELTTHVLLHCLNSRVTCARGWTRRMIGKMFDECASVHLYTSLCAGVSVYARIHLCSFVCVSVWLFVCGLRHCRLSGVDENPPRTCLQFSEIDSDELLPQRFTRQPLSFIIILVFNRHLSSGHYFLFEQGKTLKSSYLYPDANQQRN